VDAAEVAVAAVHAKRVGNVLTFRRRHSARRRC
jgi:hypothetical protein